MRVYFNAGQHSYPKGDRKSGLIYMYYCHGRICIARKYVEIKELPQNRAIKRMQTISLAVWSDISPRVKRDFSGYARQFKQEYPHLRSKHIGSYAVFLKVMHRVVQGLSKNMTSQLTAEEISGILTGYSVADFVKAGILQRVSRFHQYRTPIGGNCRRFREIKADENIEKESVFQGFSIGYLTGQARVSNSGQSPGESI